MTHLDNELHMLKTEMGNMLHTVLFQLDKAKEACINGNNDLAREVVAREKRVNAYELKIDRDCENIIALFNPVAIDLRLVLSTLKINTNLERIGDFAEGLAKISLVQLNGFDKELAELVSLTEIFDDAIEMLSDAKVAFEKENSQLAASILSKDDLLDNVNRKANSLIEEYIKKNPDKIAQALDMISIVRKIERIGDHCSNIAEEIIFYIEAKVLKHQDKK
jgi:phosphate transport system protein